MNIKLNSKPCNEIVLKPASTTERPITMTSRITRTIKYARTRFALKLLQQFESATPAHTIIASDVTNSVMASPEFPTSSRNRNELTAFEMTTIASILSHTAMP